MLDDRRVVAIRPKPTFRPLLEIATTREGSGIVLVQERTLGQNGHEAETPNQPPPDGREADGNPCLWWRRGRVELPVQKAP